MIYCLFGLFFDLAVTRAMAVTIEAVTIDNRIYNGCELVTIEVIKKLVTVTSIEVTRAQP